MTLNSEGTHLTLAGSFMLRFAENGLCDELREYWIIGEASWRPPKAGESSRAPARPLIECLITTVTEASRKPTFGTCLWWRLSVPDRQYELRNPGTRPVRERGSPR